jgi:hypothetical protein
MTYSAPARAASRSLAAVALVALIGTACSNTPAETGSGGGENPATTGGPTGDVGDQNGPTGPPPGPAELQELLKDRRESAKCMRENGVEDFPDPDANGYILYYGDDPDMTSASEKCDDLQPVGRSREPGNGG